MDLDGVKDLGGKVPAQEAPLVAVRGGSDVQDARIMEAAVGRRRRSRGKGGAVLDEGFVGKIAIDDEDRGMRSKAEGDDGAELRTEFSEEDF